MNKKRRMRHYEVKYYREYDGQLFLRHKYTYACSKAEAIERVREFVRAEFGADIIDPIAEML